MNNSAALSRNVRRRPRSRLSAHSGIDADDNDYANDDEDEDDVSFNYAGRDGKRSRCAAGVASASVSDVDSVGADAEVRIAETASTHMVPHFYKTRDEQKYNEYYASALEYARDTITLRGVVNANIAFASAPTTSSSVMHPDKFTPRGALGTEETKLLDLKATDAHHQAIASKRTDASEECAQQVAAQEKAVLVSLTDALTAVFKSINPLDDVLASSIALAQQQIKSSSIDDLDPNSTHSGSSGSATIHRDREGNNEFAQAQRVYDHKRRCHAQLERLSRANARQRGRTAVAAAAALRWCNIAMSAEAIAVTGTELSDCDSDDESSLGSGSVQTNLSSSSSVNASARAHVADHVTGLPANINVIESSDIDDILFVSCLLTQRATSASDQPFPESALALIKPLHALRRECRRLLSLRRRAVEVALEPQQRLMLALGLSAAWCGTVDLQEPSLRGYLIDSPTNVSTKPSKHIIARSAHDSRVIGGEIENDVLTTIQKNLGDLQIAFDSKPTLNNNSDGSVHVHPDLLRNSRDGKSHARAQPSLLVKQEKPTHSLVKPRKELRPVNSSNDNDDAADVTLFQHHDPYSDGNNASYDGSGAGTSTSDYSNTVNRGNGVSLLLPRTNPLQLFPSSQSQTSKKTANNQKVSSDSRVVSFAHPHKRLSTSQSSNVDVSHANNQTHCILTVSAGLQRTLCSAYAFATLTARGRFPGFDRAMLPATDTLADGFCHVKDETLSKVRVLLRKSDDLLKLAASVAGNAFVYSGTLQQIAQSPSRSRRACRRLRASVVGQMLSQRFADASALSALANDNSNGTPAKLFSATTAAGDDYAHSTTSSSSAFVADPSLADRGRSLTFPLAQVVNIDINGFGAVHPADVNARVLIPFAPPEALASVRPLALQESRLGFQVPVPGHAHSRSCFPGSITNINSSRECTHNRSNNSSFSASASASVLDHSSECSECLAANHLDSEGPDSETGEAKWYDNAQAYGCEGVPVPWRWLQNNAKRFTTQVQSRSQALAHSQLPLRSQQLNSQSLALCADWGESALRAAAATAVLLLQHHQRQEQQKQHQQHQSHKAAGKPGLNITNNVVPRSAATQLESSLYCNAASLLAVGAATAAASAPILAKRPSITAARVGPVAMGRRRVAMLSVASAVAAALRAASACGGAPWGLGASMTELCSQSLTNILETQSLASLLRSQSLANRALMQSPSQSAFFLRSPAMVQNDNDDDEDNDDGDNNASLTTSCTVSVKKNMTLEVTLGGSFVVSLRTAQAYPSHSPVLSKYQALSSALAHVITPLLGLSHDDLDTTTDTLSLSTNGSSINKSNDDIDSSGLSRASESQSNSSGAVLRSQLLSSCCNNAVNALRFQFPALHESVTQQQERRFTPHGSGGCVRKSHCAVSMNNSLRARSVAPAAVANVLRAAHALVTPQYALKQQLDGDQQQEYPDHDHSEGSSSSRATASSISSASADNAATLTGISMSSEDIAMVDWTGVARTWALVSSASATKMALTQQTSTSNGVFAESPMITLAPTVLVKSQIIELSPHLRSQAQRSVDLPLDSPVYLFSSQSSRKIPPGAVADHSQLEQWDSLRLHSQPLMQSQSLQSALSSAVSAACGSSDWAAYLAATSNADDGTDDDEDGDDGGNGDHSGVDNGGMDSGSQSQDHSQENEGDNDDPNSPGTRTWDKAVVSYCT